MRNDNDKDKCGVRVLRDRTVYGLGRTRSSDPSGRVTGYHLNPYVNCIHANAGGCWETMLILVIEIEE